VGVDFEEDDETLDSVFDLLFDNPDALESLQDQIENEVEEALEEELSFQELSVRSAELERASQEAVVCWYSVLLLHRECLKMVQF
jgi:hypothetical protein